jgi:hypothetical protein
VGTGYSRWSVRGLPSSGQVLFLVHHGAVWREPDFLVRQGGRCFLLVSDFYAQREALLLVSTFYARWIAGPTSREAPFLPGGRLLCGTGGAPPSLGVYSWCIAVPFGRNRFAGQVRGGEAPLPCGELLCPTGSAPPSGRVLFLTPSGGPLRGLRRCPEQAALGCPGGALPCGYLLPLVHHSAVRREPLFTVGHDPALPSMWPPFMRNGKRPS